MPCLVAYARRTMDDIICCNADSLKHDLIARKQILLLDCRPQVDYNTSHIASAINVTLPNLMLKRLKRGTLNIACVIQSNEAKARFAECALSHVVLLYDEVSTDLATNPSCVLSLLVRKLKHDGSAVSFLVGGFSTFQARYPELCIVQNEDDSTILGLRNLKIADDASSIDDNGRTPPQLSPFPVKVLSFLYLGNAKNSADLALLRTYGIRYILNVTPNVPNMFETDGSFKYMQIPIDDHWSQNLSVFFSDAIKFIDEARVNDSAVLVHCLAGVSRSVTVTVAYLMQQRRMSLNAAYDFVKRCKPNISPNFNFMGQLLDFERSLGLVAGEGRADAPGIAADNSPGACDDVKSPHLTEPSPNAECISGLTLESDLLPGCRRSGIESMVLSSSSGSSEASPNYKTLSS